MIKEFYIDVETTGLDTKNSAIWQIAGEVIIDSISKEIFEFKLAPHPNAFISDKALSMNDITIEELETFTPPNQVFNSFESLLKKYVSPFDKTDKLIFKGYNGNFDSDFIRSFFVRNGSNYYGSYFWTPVYDVMAIAFLALESQRSGMPNFRLETVARHLGINVETARFHDAMYDIEITKQIDTIARRMISSIVSEKDLGL
jgi:DNA polymerase III subunit epsilon